MDLEGLLRARDPNMTGVVDKEELATRRASIIPFIVITVIWMVLGTLGNTLVIVSVTRVKSLRTEHNIFILNLAVADLFITAFVDPFNILGAIEGERFFYTRGVLCEIVGVVCLSSCFTSLLSIDAISINRYIHVCHRDIYKKIYSRRKCTIICFFLWVLGFFLCFPTLVGWGDMIYDRKTLSCIYDRLADYSYTMFFIFAGVGIPVVTMAALYSKIYWMLKTSEVRMGGHQSVTESARSKHERCESLRLAKTLFVVFLAYVTCWLPYATVVLADFGDKYSGDVHTYAVLLAHTNSGINFIIYGLTNTTFRRGYRQVVQSWKSRYTCWSFSAANSIFPNEEETDKVVGSPRLSKHVSTNTAGISTQCDNELKDYLSPNSSHFQTSFGAKYGTVEKHIDDTGIKTYAVDKDEAVDNCLL